VRTAHTEALDEPPPLAEDAQPMSTTPGLYGDTSTRDYGDKLTAFTSFAAPELRSAIGTLGIGHGHRVLDVGCGTGQLTRWLAEATPAALVVGVDLARAHLHAARTRHAVPVCIQADAGRLPFGNDTFDWIWTSNTLNHLPDPVQWLRDARRLLRRDGRVVIAQASFLPDMIFAWDARLEREVTYACRAYYCRKYGLDEAQLSAPRDWVGRLRAAGYDDVRAETRVIERTAPLSPADRAYFTGWFRDYWDHRVQAFLSEADWRVVQALTDPTSPAFAPDRADFHALQTYTLVSGRAPGVVVPGR